MAREQGSAQVRSRLVALLCTFVVGFGAVLLVLVLLQRIGLATGWIDPGYFALGIAAAAVIAALGRLFDSEKPDTPALGTPAVFRGLALATDTVSATFFLGLAGAVFAWGHDGLAFALGLGAGYLLLQLLIAPVLPRSGARSVPELFALRYGGRAPRLCAMLVVAVSMTTLLVAQLAARPRGARLLGLDLGSAVAVAPPRCCSASR
jgi:cation/acetate symporter